VKCATSDEDRPEYERLRKGLISLLIKFGGYEPFLDDILVDQIASSTIYWKKLEAFMDAKTATEHTFVRMADSKMKFQKMIETAVRELALSRRDRIGQQGEVDLTRKLREAIDKARKA
jgi:hypothetical protein